MSTQDRVLVRDGRRHHRPRYSATEFRIGIVVSVLLALIVTWVIWRGQHPDPSLFSDGTELLEPVVMAPAVIDRGPLPEGLASSGWREGEVSSFDSDTLYEKINGREGFYKSFGFKTLWFASYILESDPRTAVDVEIYDLQEAGNALGAYAGERPQGGQPDVRDDGLSHLDRNALVLTRGPLYIRAIGSDDSNLVKAQLTHLRDVFEAQLEGEELPWAYGLFVGGLGVDPGQVGYLAENAFSFGFAKNVYVATLEDESEVFVVQQDSPDSARALATQFEEGFASYGRAIEASMGVKWIEDRYIRTVAGATSLGSFTVGVRGAPDRASAENHLRRIQAVVQTSEVGSEN